MADEPENVEETQDASASEEAQDASPSEAQRTSETEGEAAAAGASASDADATSEAEGGEEPVAEEPVAEEPVAEAPAAEEAPAAPEPAAPAERAAVLGPKERRRVGRAAKAAAVPARPTRSPEERQVERLAERRRKAGVRRARRQREREKASTARAAAPAPEQQAAREQRVGKQKTRQGIVVSDRASKTITVRIDLARRHPLYGKVVRTSSTLHAHDEREDAHIGDTVVLRESRPLSRTKRWRLVEVLERAK